MFCMQMKRRRIYNWHTIMDMTIHMVQTKRFYDAASPARGKRYQTVGLIALTVIGPSYRHGPKALTGPLAVTGEAR